MVINKDWSEEGARRIVCGASNFNWELYPRYCFSMLRIESFGKIDIQQPGQLYSFYFHEKLGKNFYSVEKDKELFFEKIKKTKNLRHTVRDLFYNNMVSYIFFLFFFSVFVVTLKQKKVLQSRYKNAAIAQKNVTIRQFGLQSCFFKLVFKFDQNPQA